MGPQLRFGFCGIHPRTVSCLLIVKVLKALEETT
jgi:hypothetical protein